MKNIKKVTGYLTEDNKIYRTLNEAMDGEYTKMLRDVIGPQSVFGINTILKHSQEIGEILDAYNRTLERVHLGEEDDEMR